MFGLTAVFHDPDTACAPVALRRRGFRRTGGGGLALRLRASVTLIISMSPSGKPSSSYCDYPVAEPVNDADGAVIDRFHRHAVERRATSDGMELARQPSPTAVERRNCMSNAIFEDMILRLFVDLDGRQIGFPSTGEGIRRRPGPLRTRRENQERCGGNGGDHLFFIISSVRPRCPRLTVSSPGCSLQWPSPDDQAASLSMRAPSATLMENYARATISLRMATLSGRTAISLDEPARNATCKPM